MMRMAGGGVGGLGEGNKRTCSCTIGQFNTSQAAFKLSSFTAWREKEGLIWGIGEKRGLEKR